MSDPVVLDGMITAHDKGRMSRQRSILKDDPRGVFGPFDPNVALPKSQRSKWMVVARYQGLVPLVTGVAFGSWVVGFLVTNDSLRLWFVVAAASAKVALEFYDRFEFPKRVREFHDALDAEPR